jgi:hypothetical protein
MTTLTAPLTGTTKGLPADSLRKTAFIGGGLYVTTFIASIAALPLLAPVLDHANYILGSGADNSVILGGILDLVTAAAGIGTAVVLFPVVRRQSEAAALGFVTSRVMEAAIILVGVMSLLSVVTLRQDLAGTAGADSASLVTAGASLVAVRDWAMLLGPGLMAVVNALLLGSLMYRSRLVPRAIPLMGLIGAPLLLASVIATMFGINEQFSLWSAIAVAPIFVWELSLGIYLVVKGFKPAPITAGMVTASAAAR